MWDKRPPDASRGQVCGPGGVGNVTGRLAERFRNAAPQSAPRRRGGACPGLVPSSFKALSAENSATTYGNDAKAVLTSGRGQAGQAPPLPALRKYEGPETCRLQALLDLVELKGIEPMTSRVRF